MIIGSEKLVVQTSDDIEKSKFTIKASSKAFEILSSGLYSDKITAVIRELSTNAYDSHVKAGKKDLPFEVQLPNALKPTFSVKDFGTGLSEEEIYTTYTTYFASDKTGSNDFVGALGLGSKSPFSYTKQFEVISRYNGTKSCYTCFIDENKEPSIAKRSCEVTDEPNGLEVTFSVNNRSDYYNFNNKAQEVFHWFSVKPHVLGNSYFSKEEPDWLLKTDSYAVYKNRNNKSGIVMGNIFYPIDVYNIEDLSEIALSVIGWGIVAFTEIGDVEFTASREKLSYTKRTIATIKRLIEEIAKDLKEEVYKRIGECKTVWEARKTFNSFHNSILHNVMTECLWNGKKIDSLIILKDYACKPIVELLTFKGSRGKIVSSMRRRIVEQIVVDERPVFYNDIKHGAYTTVQTYLADHNIKEAYMVVQGDDHFLEDTGIKECVVFCSSLPKKARKPRGQRQAHHYEPVMQYSHKIGRDDQPSYAWKDNVSVDLSGGGIYVEINRYKWRFPGTEYNFDHPHYLSDAIECLKLLGIKSSKFYGVRSAQLSLVKGRPNWISLQDLCNKIINKNNDFLLQNIWKYNAKDLKEYDWWTSRYKHQTFTDNLDSSATASKYFSVVSDIDSLSEDGINKIQSLIFLYRKISRSNLSEKVVNAEDFGHYPSIREQFVNEYPLIVHIEDAWNNTASDDSLIQYFKLIDEAKKVACFASSPYCALLGT